MNTLLHILCCTIIFTISILHSTEQNYNYRQATSDDLKPILYIINTEAYKSRTDIVVLPEIFRESALEKDIRNRRLFVATDANNNIIAFKKLFILTEQVEFND